MGDLVGYGKVFFVLRMGCVDLLPVARLSIVNPRVDSCFFKDVAKPFGVFGEQAILVPCMVGARSDLWNGHRGEVLERIAVLRCDISAAIEPAFQSLKLNASDGCCHLGHAKV